MLGVCTPRVWQLPASSGGFCPPRGVLGSTTASRSQDGKQGELTALAFMLWLRTGLAKATGWRSVSGLGGCSQSPPRSSSGRTGPLPISCTQPGPEAADATGDRKGGEEGSAPGHTS